MIREILLDSGKCASSVYPELKLKTKATTTYKHGKLFKAPQKHFYLFNCDTTCNLGKVTARPESVQRTILLIVFPHLSYQGAI